MPQGSHERVLCEDAGLNHEIQRMRIACLHTADSNIAVFATAAQELGMPSTALHHAVRADLLSAAENAGGLTAEIADATRLELLALAQSADVVLLTCSTLGAAVDGVRSNVPILRTDAALAAAAAAVGGKIVALCAVPTTLASTALLFCAAVRESGAMLEVRLVPGAWQRFKAGDLAGYWSLIAQAADEAYVEGAAIVALAQASMSGAQSLVAAGPTPLSSPHAGLACARAAASRALGH